MAADADRDLLFGLLALQNGIINQGQLLAAFQAWTLDKGRRLADYLEARGDLTSTKRVVLDALAAMHLEAHGGDVEKSLAAVPTNRATRASLVELGEPAIEATLARVAGSRNGHASEPDGDDADRTANYSVGTTTCDGQRFRILRPHARGGLGAVFVALDAELHREVALKQILERHADDPVSRQRFVLEAEITGGLEHPGVVPVYGLGTYADGRPYYAMRFINGDSLKDAIERSNEVSGSPELELRRLLRRFLDVCNAIDYAHSRGVIHRDLKPANIIVGKYGETLVVDWGLAKLVSRADPSAGEQTLAPSSSGSSETLPGSAMGTPAYMSPEQARGELEKLGPRSDVYSLGATLYCLLTGKPPFEGEDVGAILRAVQDGHFDRPSRHDPALDKALEAACLKAMAARPEDRYSTAKELADDLERWMADEPVTAWHEPLSRRARRWARRQRTAVTAIAASVLVALAGTGAVLAVQTQANGRLTRANRELSIANGKVARANNDLKSANERERARFNLAMDAIKLFHGEVSEDLLLKEKQFESLRTKLLKGAANFYGRLEGLLKGQTDRDARAALGTAYSELGALTEKIGDQTAALAVFRKSLAVRRALLSESGAGAQNKLDVAESLLSAGWLRKTTGDIAGARASFEEAQDLAEKAEAERGDAKQAQQVQGTAHNRIGVVLYETSDPAGALARLREALALRQKLADAEPENAALLTDLASTIDNIANALAIQSRATESMAMHERATSILERAVRIDRSVTSYQMRLASELHDAGWLRAEIGDAVGARATFGRALLIEQGLADTNPSVTPFQQGLATSHTEIGRVLAQTGDLVGARAAYDRALAILEKLADANPSVTYFQERLATVLSSRAGLLSNTGAPADARAAYGRARAIWQKLVDANPSVRKFQQALAHNYNYVGGLLSRMGDPAGARAAYGQAQAILRKLAETNPSVTALQQELSTSPKTSVIKNRTYVQFM
jgi:eukaryotic-like serine/threonine-protein kinase